MTAKTVLQEGLIWRVGNGESVNIWFDRWIPRPSTFKVQSPMQDHYVGWKVSSLIDKSTSYWNQVLLREMANAEEVEVISRIPISVSNAPDKMVWRCTSNGKFSVKSVYHLLCDMEVSKKGVISKIIEERHLG